MLRRVASALSCLVVVASSLFFLGASGAQAWESWEGDRTCKYYEQLRLRSKNSVGSTVALHTKGHSQPATTQAGYWNPAGTVTRESWAYYGPSRQYFALTAFSNAYLSHKSALCIDTGIR